MLVQVLVLKVSGFHAKAVKNSGIPGFLHTRVFAAKTRVYLGKPGFGVGGKTGVETGKQVLVQACLNSCWKHVLVQVNSSSKEVLIHMC